MRVPEYSAVCNASPPTDLPLIIHLRMGNFAVAAKVPKGNSEISARPKPESVPPAGNFLSDKMTSAPVPNTAMVLPLAEIAPRWLAVSAPRTPPLIMTSPYAARSQAKRSAIPRTVGRGVAACSAWQCRDWSALPDCCASATISGGS